METIGYDVITTEPEWDAEQRAMAFRLDDYEGRVCNCGCGLPTEVAHDKTQFFIVEEATCQARRAIEKVRTKKREDAMRAKRGEGWDAGLKLYARPVTREEAEAHMAAEAEKADAGEVGPRMAAAQAQRARRDSSQRLGAKARERRRA